MGPSINKGDMVPLKMGNVVIFYELLHFDGLEVHPPFSSMMVKCQQSEI
jgi:hypothetical protein